MGARQSTKRQQDKEVPRPPPVSAARREGLNAPAAALCGAGLSSLLAYRLTAPRAVAGVSSPGAVAGRALALGTLLSVGTFSFIIGGLAAAYDVRTASEAVTAARRAAPPRVDIKFRAPHAIDAKPDSLVDFHAGAARPAPDQRAVTRR